MALETAELQYFYPEDLPKLAITYPHQLFTLSSVFKTYFEWNKEGLEDLI